jgi:two-component system, sensor histidine kinase and response regulator
MGTAKAEARPSVLLVDDVEANLRALEAVLAGVDCDLVRAGSGEEALRLLLKRPFAVMLLDVQMPGMDGYEVARYARESSFSRDVPIIFLTAMHQSLENTLQGYGTGALDLLYKPVDPQVVRAKVRSFVDFYVARRRLVLEIEAHRATLANLEVANEALRHFTNAASHDLRAPLRAVNGFLDALAEETEGTLSETARAYLDRARHGGARMVSLLDSLLAYARLQRPLVWEEVDCRAVVEQVASDLAERLANEGAHLNVVGALDTVRGDPDRIYQLFLNLVGNAIKFHRPGESPEVTVSAERAGAEAIFAVQDNGLGIERRHQATLFEGFRRVHGSRDYEGSGLGLAICRQIAEQHGGRIWVESEPGQGARFCVAMPVAAEASASAAIG